MANKTIEDGLKPYEHRRSPSACSSGRPRHIYDIVHRPPIA